MSFKRTIPYFLTSAAMLFGMSHTMGSTGTDTPIEPDATTAAAKVKPVTQPRENADTVYAIADIKIRPDAVIDAIAHNYDVVYTRADGNKFRRSGGTRAWRNNNPGCLRYSDFSITQGAIGRAGGFAVFPDEQTGVRAIGALLKSKNYKNLSIAQAIFKYAPPHENNTAGYNATLRRLTGLDTSIKLSQLNDEQIMRVVNAIRVVEGWRTGRETHIAAPKSEISDSVNLYANVRANLTSKSVQKTL